MSQSPPKCPHGGDPAHCSKCGEQEQKATQPKVLTPKKTSGSAPKRDQQAGASAPAREAPRGGRGGRGGKHTARQPSGRAKSAQKPTGGGAKPQAPKRASKRGGRRSKKTALVSTQASADIQRLQGENDGLRQALTDQREAREDDEKERAAGEENIGKDETEIVLENKVPVEQEPQAFYGPVCEPTTEHVAFVVDPRDCMVDSETHQPIVREWEEYSGLPVETLRMTSHHSLFLAHVFSLLQIMNNYLNDPRNHGRRMVIMGGTPRRIAYHLRHLGADLTRFHFARDDIESFASSKTEDYRRIVPAPPISFCECLQGYGTVFGGDYTRRKSPCRHFPENCIVLIFEDDHNTRAVAGMIRKRFEVFHFTLRYADGGGLVFGRKGTTQFYVNRCSQHTSAWRDCRSFAIKHRASRVGNEEEWCDTIRLPVRRPVMAGMELVTQTPVLAIGAYSLRRLQLIAYTTRPSLMGVDPVFYQVNLYAMGKSQDPKQRRAVMHFATAAALYGEHKDCGLGPSAVANAVDAALSAAHVPQRSWWFGFRNQWNAEIVDKYKLDRREERYTPFLAVKQFVIVSPFLGIAKWSVDKARRYSHSLRGDLATLAIAFAPLYEESVKSVISTATGFHRAVPAIGFGLMEMWGYYLSFLPLTKRVGLGPFLTCRIPPLLMHAATGWMDFENAWLFHLIWNMFAGAVHAQIFPEHAIAVTEELMNNPEFLPGIPESMRPKLVASGGWNPLMSSFAPLTKLKWGCIAMVVAHLPWRRMFKWARNLFCRSAPKVTRDTTHRMVPVRAVFEEPDPTLRIEFEESLCLRPSAMDLERKIEKGDFELQEDASIHCSKMPLHAPCKPTLGALRVWCGSLLEGPRKEPVVYAPCHHNLYIAIAKRFLAKTPEPKDYMVILYQETLYKMALRINGATMDPGHDELHSTPEYIAATKWSKSRIAEALEALKVGRAMPPLSEADEKYEAIVKIEPSQRKTKPRAIFVQKLAKQAMASQPTQVLFARFKEVYSILQPDEKLPVCGAASGSTQAKLGDWYDRVVRKLGDCVAIEIDGKCFDGSKNWPISSSNIQFWLAICRGHESAVIKALIASKRWVSGRSKDGIKFKRKGGQPSGDDNTTSDNTATVIGMVELAYNLYNSRTGARDFTHGAATGDDLGQLCVREHAKPFADTICEVYTACGLQPECIMHDVPDHMSFCSGIFWRVKGGGHVFGPTPGRVMWKFGYHAGRIQNMSPEIYIGRKALGLASIASFVPGLYFLKELAFQFETEFQPKRHTPLNGEGWKRWQDVDRTEVLPAFPCEEAYEQFHELYGAELNFSDELIAASLHSIRSAYWVDCAYVRALAAAQETEVKFEPVDHDEMDLRAPAEPEVYY